MTTENRAGHPLRNASLAAVIVILLALLVFPGFLAAALSRGKNPMVALALGTSATSTDITGAFICPDTHATVLQAVFIPADILMMKHPAIFTFYEWQYDLAGGKRIWIN